MTTAKLNPQTNPSIPPHADDRLDRFIVVSLVFHLLLFILIAVRAYFVPSEPIPLERAIRVDIVALPEKRTSRLPPSRPAEVAQPQETKAPAPKPAETKPAEPKPEPPKPVVKKVPPKQDSTKINLEKTKQSQEAALRRLRAIEKLKSMNPSEGTKKEQTASALVKGNEISAGNSLTGLTKIEHENYAETVHDQIKRHWNLPQWMASANMSATVRVFIDSRGGLIKKEMIRSSNNSVFDQSVMAAIDASVPLPRPPSHLVNLIAVRGIDIEFTPARN